MIIIGMKATDAQFVQSSESVASKILFHCSKRKLFNIILYGHVSHLIAKNIFKGFLQNMYMGMAAMFVSKWKPNEQMLIILTPEG